MKQPLAAGSALLGVALYSRSRRRWLALEPKQTICPACLTDTEQSSCPDDCPDPLNLRSKP